MDCLKKHSKEHIECAGSIVPPGDVSTCNQYLKMSVQSTECTDANAELHRKPLKLSPKYDIPNRPSLSLLQHHNRAKAAHLNSRQGSAESQANAPSFNSSEVKANMTHHADGVPLATLQMNNLKTYNTKNIDINCNLNCSPETELSLSRLNKPELLSAKSQEFQQKKNPARKIPHLNPMRQMGRKKQIGGGDAMLRRNDSMRKIISVSKIHQCDQLLKMGGQITISSTVDENEKCPRVRVDAEIGYATGQGKGLVRLKKSASKICKIEQLCQMCRRNTFTDAVDKKLMRQHVCTGTGDVNTIQKQSALIRKVETASNVPQIKQSPKIGATSENATDHHVSVPTEIGNATRQENESAKTMKADSKLHKIEPLCQKCRRTTLTDTMNSKVTRQHVCANGKDEDVNKQQNASVLHAEVDSKVQKLHQTEQKTTIKDKADRKTNRPRFSAGIGTRDPIRTQSAIFRLIQSPRKIRQFNHLLKIDRRTRTKHAVDEQAKRHSVSSGAKAVNQSRKQNTAVRVLKSVSKRTSINGTVDDKAKRQRLSAVTRIDNTVRQPRTKTGNIREQQKTLVRKVKTTSKIRQFNEVLKKVQQEMVGGKEIPKRASAGADASDAMCQQKVQSRLNKSAHKLQRKEHSLSASRQTVIASTINGKSKQRPAFSTAESGDTNSSRNTTVRAIKPANKRNHFEHLFKSGRRTAIKKRIGEKTMHQKVSATGKIAKAICQKKVPARDMKCTGNIRKPNEILKTTGKIAKAICQKKVPARNMKCTSNIRKPKEILKTGKCTAIGNTVNGKVKKLNVFTGTGNDGTKGQQNGPIREKKAPSKTNQLNNLIKKNRRTTISGNADQQKLKIRLMKSKSKLSQSKQLRQLGCRAAINGKAKQRRDCPIVGSRDKYGQKNVPIRRMKTPSKTCLFNKIVKKSQRATVRDKVNGNGIRQRLSAGADAVDAVCKKRVQNRPVKSKGKGKLLQNEQLRQVGRRTNVRKVAGKITRSRVISIAIHGDTRGHQNAPLRKTKTPIKRPKFSNVGKKGQLSTKRGKGGVNEIQQKVKNQLVRSKTNLCKSKQLRQLGRQRAIGGFINGKAVQRPAFPNARGNDIHGKKKAPVRQINNTSKARQINNIIKKSRRTTLRDIVNGIKIDQRAFAGNDAGFATCHERVRNGLKKSKSKVPQIEKRRQVGQRTTNVSTVDGKAMRRRVIPGSTNGGSRGQQKRSTPINIGLFNTVLKNGRRATIKGTVSGNEICQRASAGADTSNAVRQQRLQSVLMMSKSRLPKYEQFRQVGQWITNLSTVNGKGMRRRFVQSATRGETTGHQNETVRKRKTPIKIGMFNAVLKNGRRPATRVMVSGNEFCQRASAEAGADADNAVRQQRLQRGLMKSKSKLSKNKERRQVSQQNTNVSTVNGKGVRRRFIQCATHGETGRHQKSTIKIGLLNTVLKNGRRHPIRVMVSENEILQSASQGAHAVDAVCQQGGQSQNALMRQMKITNNVHPLKQFPILLHEAVVGGKAMHQRVRVGTNQIRKENTTDRQKKFASNVRPLQQLPKVNQGTNVRNTAICQRTCTGTGAIKNIGCQDQPIRPTDPTSKIRRFKKLRKMNRQCTFRKTITGFIKLSRRKVPVRQMKSADKMRQLKQLLKIHPLT